VITDLKGLLQATIFQYRAVKQASSQRADLIAENCPACSRLTCALMIDVQFAIKNLKRTRGRHAEHFREMASLDGPRGSVLGPRTNIDLFCDQHSGAALKSNCSSFEAVEDAYKKKGNAHLDTSAVMTCVCRHDICTAILQLRHGERYAYGLYILLEVCGLWSPNMLLGLSGDVDTLTQADAQHNDNEDAILQPDLPAIQVAREALTRASPWTTPSSNQPAYGDVDSTQADEKRQDPVYAWLYDIACQFRPYLRNRLTFLRTQNPTSPLIAAIKSILNMTSAVGAAHVLGHQLLCQLLESARHIPGLGTTDGENCERFQAYLIYFRNQLKYCNPMNFRKFLASITLNHNQQKIMKMDKILSKRSVDATKLSVSSCDDAKALIDSLPQSIDRIEDGKKLRDIINSVWDFTRNAFQEDSKVLRTACLGLLDLALPVQHQARTMPHPADLCDALDALQEVSSKRAMYRQQMTRIRTSHLSHRKLKKHILTCDQNIRKRVDDLNKALTASGISRNMTNRLIITYAMAKQHNSLWWDAARSGAVGAEVRALMCYIP
jgi:hypothetical protein